MGPRLPQRAIGCHGGDRLGITHVGGLPTQEAADAEIQQCPIRLGGHITLGELQVVRHLQGLNIVGADMVEVSPPFDQAGGTAFLGVSVMFELLCVMAAGVK